MSSVKIIELEASRVRFFSQHDEAAFFEWLKKVSCVNGCEGRGFSVFISIDSDKVTEDDLRELLALFRRYGVSMGQLSAFDREEFAGWFRDKRAYWFSAVFGEQQ